MIKELKNKRVYTISINKSDISTRGDFYRNTQSRIIELNIISYLRKHNIFNTVACWYESKYKYYVELCD